VDERSDGQFRLLVDSVRDYAILSLDDDGLVTTWNLGAERIKGYRTEEIISRHFSMFYPPADVAGGVPAAELAAATADARNHHPTCLFQAHGGLRSERRCWPTTRSPTLMNPGRRRI
jgi:PAS domain-containing protein